MLGKMIKEDEFRLTGEIGAIRRVMNDKEAESEKHLWSRVSGRVRRNKECDRGPWISKTSALYAGAVDTLACFWSQR